MKTKNGIELELSESEYTCIYNGFKFYFSSKFYKDKFVNAVESYVNIETVKLINKYKININLRNYLSVSLYRKIEKRGFLIQDVFSSVYFTESEINSIF